MMTEWYPTGWPVPEKLRTEHLWLRMLAPEHTERDYDALMESRERLRKWSGSTWPADDFTLAGNEQDLIEHEREFHAREAFAYTVMNPDGSLCEGCVYINPLQIDAWNLGSSTGGSRQNELSDAHGAVVAFWVRESALERELDAELLDGLLKWLRNDWQFSAIAFMTQESLVHDGQLFVNAGLRYVGSARKYPTRQLYLL